MGNLLGQGIVHTHIDTCGELKASYPPLWNVLPRLGKPKNIKETHIGRIC